MCLCAGVLSACAELHAYSIALATPYDGKAVIQNEEQVARYLHYIVDNDGSYSMRAFSRKAISNRVQKTDGTTHRFYVISRNDGSYDTLSFSATNKWAVSQGAWAMNTQSDRDSYSEYLHGNNTWEVEEIITAADINTVSTIGNVLVKLEGRNTYFFRARVDRNDRHDNCNTALLETLEES